MEQKNNFFYPLSNIFNKKYDDLQEVSTNSNSSIITNNNNNNNNNNNIVFDKKRNYKIAIYGEPPYLIPHEVKETGLTTYSGFLYEIWANIYDVLKKQPDIGNIEQEFIISSKTGITYDDMYNLVKEGKYDMAVANFSILGADSGRTGNLYTRPIYLNKLAIGYIPEDHNIEWFFKILFKEFLPPLVALLILCIIFGIIVNKYSHRGSFITDMWQSFTTLLGGGALERRLSDNPLRQTWKSYFAVFIILIVAFYFDMYLQARITTGLSELSQTQRLLDDLSGREILKTRGTKGYSFIEENLGGVLVDVPTDKNIIDYYVNNHVKYHGFVKSFVALIQAKKKYPRLQISQQNWGYDEIGFIIHNDIEHYYLQNEINDIIVHLQKQGIIINKCKQYLGQDNAYLCIL